MSEPQKKVEIVSAEVVSAEPDAVEVALDVRITALEADEVEQEKNLRGVLLSLVHLQEASLKHSVSLGLLLAVLFFVASRALGA